MENAFRSSCWFKVIPERICQRKGGRMGERDNQFG